MHSLSVAGFGANIIVDEFALVVVATPQVIIVNLRVRLMGRPDKFKVLWIDGGAREEILLRLDLCPSVYGLSICEI